MAKKIVHYHLPGLFEFYELYARFLPLTRAHPEYFYDWCDIASIYGAPANCLWGGGRVGAGDVPPRRVLALLRAYGISARLTFSNSLLGPEHLADARCNRLCRLLAEDGNVANGVIVHSDLLADYLRQTWPQLYLVSSTTKVLTDFPALRRELERPEFRYVVPDFRLNKAFAQLAVLPAPLRDKVEFLCNECCRPQSLLRGRQPQKSRPGRPRTPLHRARRGRGIPLLPRDGKPRVYRRGGYPRHLPADGVHEL